MVLQYNYVVLICVHNLCVQLYTVEYDRKILHLKSFPVEDFSHKLVKEGFLMYRDAVLSKVHLRVTHTTPILETRCENNET